ncbi:MAG TPA: YihY/virulence factor BrkB family protein [Steroidobacteraceae bacterium]
MPSRKLWTVIKQAALNWSADNASSIGAALAFYCAFSLAPLLVIVVTIVGRIVGTQMAYGYVASELTALLGGGSAQLLLSAMRSSQTQQGSIATIVSIVSLLVGATSVFAVLGLALEQMWGIETRVSRGWWGFVRTRLMSLGVILAIGFLLLVSLSITTAVSALRGYIAHQYTGFVILTEAVNIFLSLGTSTALVALIYQYMPIRRLAWKPVLTGALVTALLFHVGRWAIGLYLSKAVQPSAFGAAASFAALLLWLYYSAQIFLYGAEFTACLSDPQNGRRASTPKSALK